MNLILRHKYVMDKTNPNMEVNYPTDEQFLSSSHAHVTMAQLVEAGCKVRVEFPDNSWIEYWDVDRER